MHVDGVGRHGCKTRAQQGVRKWVRGCVNEIEYHRCPFDASLADRLVTARTLQLTSPATVHHLPQGSSSSALSRSIELPTFSSQQFVSRLCSVTKNRPIACNVFVHPFPQLLMQHTYRHLICSCLSALRLCTPALKASRCFHVSCGSSLCVRWCPEGDRSSPVCWSSVEY